MKAVVSAGMYVVEVWRDGTFDWHVRLKSEVSDALSGWRAFRFAIPAIVYLVENHLRFLVLKALDSPVTWVVFSHVEIPIVALMSYACLSRPLTRSQWIAIVLLLDGVMASEIALCHSRENRSCDAMADYPLAALGRVASRPSPSPLQYAADAPAVAGEGSRERPTPDKRGWRSFFSGEVACGTSPPAS